MLKQFKGIKWINNVPRLLLYNLETKQMELKNINNNISIKKTNQKICNGYYDLLKREYKKCNNLCENEKTCDECKKLSGFGNCLGCDGMSCKANNDIALKFCNQPHVIYIALFGNNKFKVGTAAEYRKYERILEQGAIASMFIAKTPTGKLARLIEHKIGTFGPTLQVNSNYKIQNLVIEKDKYEIKNILEKEYNEIKNLLPDILKQYLINPKINYCEKINDINKKILLKDSSQLSLFDEEKEKNYEYILEPNDIEGEIINIVGTMLILKKEKITIYDTKKLEGWIVDINA